MKTTLLILYLLCEGSLAARAVQPEIAEFNFDSHFTQTASATNQQPAWMIGLQQEGGEFIDAPKSWHVDGSQPVGTGRLVVTLNRELLQEDVALTVLSSADEQTDLIVQLFDKEDRAIILDLFGKLIAVGKEARTDTFIVPLRTHPSATKIVIRRVRGDVKVYGAALFPVISQAQGSDQTLLELAKLLGDRLSSDSPLVQRMSQVARSKSIPLTWLQPIPNPSPGATRTTSTNDHPEFDWSSWYVMEFKDEDWGGLRRQRPVMDNGDVVLRGQEIRTRRAYTTPLTIEFDALLEEKRSNDGAVGIGFVPANQPIDKDMERLVGVVLLYNHDGDALLVHQRFRRWPTHDGKNLARHELPIEPGRVYHYKIEVLNTGLRVTIDGREYDTGGATVPYDKFCVYLSGWQPDNRWHVRNFRMR